MSKKEKRNKESSKAMAKCPNDLLQTNISFNKKGVFLISGALLIIIALFFFNTIYMRQKLIEETRRYVTDVSTHTVSNLSSVLRESSTCIEEMADSFSRIPKTLMTEEVLKRKASIWELDGLAIINLNGERKASDTFCERFDNWVESHPEIYDENVVSYILNHKIIFSSPIIREGEEKAALVGVKKYDTVQKLLSNTDFQGRGQSFIVNNDGIVIFDPEEKKDTIYDIYGIHSNFITEKLKNGKEGIFDIKNANHSHILISIQSLNIEDWKLLTMVPQDMLVKTSMRPVFIFMFIIILSAVVFLMILIYIYKFQKALIQQLTEYSFVDSVTGGLNGLAFRLKSKKLVEKADAGSYAVVFLNILNFKQINERWGIVEGNKVLKYIYEKINEMLDLDEYIVRSELDHYFLILHHTTKKELIDRIYQLLNKTNSFRDYAHVEDEYFLFDFSLGIYVIEDIQEDIRLCQGKARRAAGFGKGKNICTFYDNKLVKKELYNKHLNEIFDSALKKEHFEIYLQPKVHLNHDDAPCAEALIRWNHPKEGMIYPSDFIPLFEKNGKICRLDLYVFEKVCKLIHMRKQNQKTMFPVSVNLSKAHLNSDNMEFVDKIISLKKKYEIPNGILEIEMTESIMIEDSQLPAIKKMIDAFHDNGILCSLDDFGFGFSSLGILKSLDIDIIKLDRKFLMDENEKTWFIVSNFINLAHGLGMKTVAEGVESMAQVECLRSADCDMIQGYFYGKPMPVSDFIQWYETRRNHL